MRLKHFVVGMLGLVITLDHALAATRLDMTNEYTATSLHGQGDQYFADQVNQLSNGDIEITLHTGASLGFKSQDHLNAVGDGIIPIADTLSSVLAGTDPVFTLSSLPFLATSPDEARQLYLAAKPAYDKFFEDKNQILLYASPWPPSGIWSKEVVDTIEALEGLKIRTYDSNGTRTMMEAGAAPIQLSWADVLPQLATNGISALLTSAEGGISISAWDHLTNFTEVNYAMPLNIVHMNRDIFNDLSDTEQQAILNAAAATDARNWDALVEQVEQNYKEMRENGVVIAADIDPSLMKRLQESGHTVVKRWLNDAGKEAQQVLTNYNENLK